MTNPWSLPFLVVLAAVGVAGAVVVLLDARNGMRARRCDRWLYDWDTDDAIVRRAEEIVAACEVPTERRGSE